MNGSKCRVIEAYANFQFKQDKKDAACQLKPKQTTKENNKMKVSRVNEYYGYYMRAVNYYGHRRLSDCYKNPSCAKMSAERAIIDEMCSKGGYGYSVITYNSNIFTCGYLFNRDGELWFVIHTPTKYGEMKVEED